MCFHSTSDSSPTVPPFLLVHNFSAQFVVLITSTLVLLSLMIEIPEQLAQARVGQDTVHPFGFGRRKQKITLHNCGLNLGP